MITQVFTFGYGHTCPYTGESLADQYATIVAPDKEQCRALMLAVFGRQWAFQYDSVEHATKGGRYPMTEHVRLTIGPPLPPPADPDVWMAAERRGLDYHRIAAGNVTGCGRSMRTGVIVKRSEAVADREAGPCPRCWPDGEGGAS